MRLALVFILILGRAIQTYSQDIELLTKQTKNQNSTEKGENSKFKKVLDL